MCIYHLIHRTIFNGKKNKNITPKIIGRNKYCSKCSQNKDLSEFFDPKLANKYGIVCMDCKKITQREKERRKYYKRKGLPYLKKEEETRIATTNDNSNKNLNLINSDLKLAYKLGEREIEVVYKDKRGNTTNRKITIYELNSKHLIGFCHKVNDRRTFLISGIIELKRLEI